MQLIFHDRRQVSTLPTGEALLTIERKGTFSLSIAASLGLELKPTDKVVLAQDLETNTWYLVLDPAPTLTPFELRPRDKSSKALIFCSQHRARAYYEAHGLGEQKSVRSVVSVAALENKGGELHQLTPQHPTKTLEAVVGAPADTLEHLADIRATEFPSEVASQPDVAPLPSDLPQMQAEQQAAPPMVPSIPVAVSGVPALTPGQLPESRGEQLADYWNEREISLATPTELEEVIKVLGAMPRGDRGFTENKVLNQAKTEQAKRVKEAGKGKGGKRG